MSTNLGKDILEQGGPKEAATQPLATEVTASATAAPIKKIISCTQCRRRKLKCDRVKPCCGTCSRLQHSCIYPEGRVKSTSKRRNVKDLEARLAQVESLLKCGGSSKTSPDADPTGPMDPDFFQATEADWEALEMDLGMEDDDNEMADIAAAIPILPPLLVNEPFCNEIIGFGMQEQLPPAEMIDGLHEVFFGKVHNATPILNKYRYLANVNLSYPLGPPLCLRYIVWALAAAATDRYKPSPQEIFYQRARKYAELDEMKGRGEQFITVAHAQCWALVANYEAQNMYLSRAWISAGKGVRLVQMMNLHRIDSGDTTRQMIGPSRDWTELEERRRAFWAAFCCDRYSCAGTGWPLSIDERDITTKLPCSEEAYELGRNEEGLTLAEAMTAEGAPKISPYAGLILMACLFGQNWLHEHRSGPNDNPEDLHGEFWRRHKRMDNAILNITMFLPNHLKLPAGYRDPNIVNLNLNLQSSQICLHQTAIKRAKKHNLHPQISRRSAMRTRAAAEEIVNIVRGIDHFELAEMNPWMSFNLYLATGVLIEAFTSPDTREQSRAKLETLLVAMQSVGKKHNVTHSFMHELKNDLDNAGISSSFQTPAPPPKPTWIGPKSIWTMYGSRTDEGITGRSRVSHVGASPVGGRVISSGSMTSPVTLAMQTAMGSGTDGFYHQVNFDMRLQKPTLDDSYNPISVSGQGPASREATDPQIEGFGNSYGMPDVFTEVHGNKTKGDESRKTSRMPINSGLENNSPLFSLAYRNQWPEGTKMEGQVNDAASDLSHVAESIPSDWAFGPFDPSITSDFTGLDFDPGNGDINAMLRNATWDTNMFNSR